MNNFFGNYYKGLTRAGIIKWVIVIVAVIATAIGAVTDDASSANDKLPDIYMVFPFLFFALVLPVIMKLNDIFNDIEVTKPTWNENPWLNTRRPLVFFDFIGVVLFFSGPGYLAGSMIRQHHYYLDVEGVMLLSAGLGLFMGNFLTLKWIGREYGY